MTADGPRGRSVASIAAALEILGARDEDLHSDDLDERLTAEGDSALLAVANALYSAAIDTAMCAEARVLDERGDDAPGHLRIARRQDLRAREAMGPAAFDLLRWQAARVAQPLRAWADVDRLGPLGAAAAAAAAALTLMLDSFSTQGPSDQRVDRLINAIADAREELAAADTHLHYLQYDAADLADEIAFLVDSTATEIRDAGGESAR